jgi:hypothetical protein
MGEKHRVTSELFTTLRPDNGTIDKQDTLSIAKGIVSRGP